MASRLTIGKAELVSGDQRTVKTYASATEDAPAQYYIYIPLSAEEHETLELQSDVTWSWRIQCSVEEIPVPARPE